MSVKPCITCQITLGWNQRNLNFMEFLCDSYPPPACDVGFTTIVTPNDLDSWGDFYIHMIYGLDNEFPLKRDGFPKVMLTCWRVYHTHIYIYHISYISQALFTSLFIVPTMALWMHEKPPKKCRHWSSHGDQSIAINIMINEG